MKWSRNIVILLLLALAGPSVFAQRIPKVGPVLKKFDDLWKQIEDAINWGDALRSAPGNIEKLQELWAKQNTYSSYAGLSSTRRKSTQSSLTNPNVKAEGAEAANYVMSKKGGLPTFQLDPPKVILPDY